MQQYDYSALLGRMRAQGITQEHLAKSVGISPSSMNLKLNGKAVFRQTEINTIVDVLAVPKDRIADYFFTPKLLKTEVSQEVTT